MYEKSLTSLYWRNNKMEPLNYPFDRSVAPYRRFRQQSNEEQESFSLHRLWRHRLSNESPWHITVTVVMEHGILPLPQPPPGLPHTVPLLSARLRVLVLEDHKHPRYKVQRVVIVRNLHGLFPDFSYPAKQKNVGDSLRRVMDDLNFVRGSRLHHVMVVVTAVKRPPQKVQHPRPMYLYVGSRSHDAASYQGF